TEKDTAAKNEIRLTPSDVDSIFRQDAPDVEAFLRVKALIQRSAGSRKALVKVLEDLQAKKAPESADVARLGAALWILGRAREAAEALKGFRGSAAGSFFQAKALQDASRPDEAAAILAKLAAKDPESAVFRAALVEAHLESRDAAAAREALRGGRKGVPGTADEWVWEGKILDLEGEHDDARDAFQKAVDLDGSHAEALFRLAYAMDLYGDDEEAVQLYQKCAALPHPNVNALINLGVLYEDRGEAEKAIGCYQTVLKAYPTHPRASAFHKDALASLDEAVDEEREKLEDKRFATLKIPITDFELSVRSRNCLSKMKIRTLGDLVQKTEAELLSYKNFGETSLSEIKAILDSKGLHLGLSIEELRSTERRRRFDRLFQKGAEEDEVLSRPVAELGLSIRSRRAMETLGVNTIGDLTRKSEKELLGCANFGQTSLMEVKRKLAEFGVGLTETGEPSDAPGLEGKEGAAEEVDEEDGEDLEDLEDGKAEAGAETPAEEPEEEVEDV
ncbi:MAG: tetratricopeptide repeat protein, partial [Planctomycetes bacterium]|nr:tetratricopeptide repeat protein [Planctomycetota bacterium]